MRIKDFKSAGSHKLSLVARFVLCLGLIGAALLSGCAEVKYHQKRRFTDSMMLFGESASETHAYSKIYYSREGSVGGVGSSAGGGCGCY